jgi:hypothetical protein
MLTNNDYTQKVYNVMQQNQFMLFTNDPTQNYQKTMKHTMAECNISSSFFGPNILNTLFSSTLSLCCSLNIRDQVSHPYRTTGKIIVLYILTYFYYYYYYYYYYYDYYYCCGCFCSFLVLYTVGRIISAGDQPVARPLPTHRRTRTQNERK